MFIINVTVICPLENVGDIFLNRLFFLGPTRFTVATLTTPDKTKLTKLKRILRYNHSPWVAISTCVKYNLFKLTLKVKALNISYTDALPVYLLACDDFRPPRFVNYHDAGLRFKDLF